MIWTQSQASASCVASNLDLHERNFHTWPWPTPPAALAPQHPGRETTRARHGPLRRAGGGGSGCLPCRPERSRADYRRHRADRRVHRVGAVRRACAYDVHAHRVPAGRKPRQLRLGRRDSGLLQGYGIGSSAGRAGGYAFGTRDVPVFDASDRQGRRPADRVARCKCLANGTSIGPVPAFT